MTLQQAKEEVAKRYRFINDPYKSWEEMEIHLLSIDLPLVLNERMNLAIELYGNSQWNEAIMAAAESARLRMNGTFARPEYSVNKNSILMLKK